MTLPVHDDRPVRDRRQPTHMPEVVWQRQVQELARTLGWVDFHHLRSVGTRAGVPDLELLHPAKGMHVRVELKSETGTLSAAQVAMLDLLDRCHPAGGLRLYVWRPSDLPDATGVLQGKGSHLNGPTAWDACRLAEIDSLGPKELRRLAELHLEYGLVPR